jgi:hypothetical protein
MPYLLDQLLVKYWWKPLVYVNSIFLFGNAFQQSKEHMYDFNMDGLSLSDGIIL